MARWSSRIRCSMRGSRLTRPGAKPTIVPVATAAPRDPALRLGEALIFTTLMAPWSRSDGPLSRFTCETCHFEGYGDGRTHHTGRGDVHAVTKPLLGLFNNRPHFSRALDPDLVSVAFNEFRVANARSGHDPWFGLRVRDAPWLSALGVGDDLLSPQRLRESFMRFLMAFNHRPNPAALGRSAFSAGEQRRRARVPRPLRILPRGAPGQRRSELARAVRTLGVTGDDPRRADRLGQGPSTARPASCPTSTPRARASRRCAGSTRSGPTSPTARRRICRRCSIARATETARSGTTRKEPRTPNRSPRPPRSTLERRTALLAFLDLL